MPWLVLLVFFVGPVLLMLGSRPRYRRDLSAAYLRLESVEGSRVQSDAGTIEYADVGTGPCLLVSTGMFGVAALTTGSVR